ncbi:DUF2933 domain-containing protein [Billgrantia antri]|uniref:DUF2933 domain-containing protein n=1 Tax=Halomonas sulfidivorans TaxID=2733488 RepID=A0ABX7WG54_9GAMM|nr:DUF2933 domain-containing protein [Halomonas sulfidivorans]QTP58447.1 DUF2933 domain-containing protein [Halomonas sulfidivorans]
MNRLRSTPPLQEDHDHDGPRSAEGPRGTRSRGVHAWMMPLCLVLMGSAFLLLLWRGETAGGAWLLLPMLLCLGMHLLMHRHGHHRDE